MDRKLLILAILLRIYSLVPTMLTFFQTEGETIETKDPLCGWCTEENRSTRKTECTHSWLSSFSECVSIEASPKYISVGSRGIVDIKVTTKNFPTSLTSDARCRYLDTNGDQIGSYMNAIPISNDAFTCKDPDFLEHDVLLLQLVVLDSSNMFKFAYAETAIQLYKCDQFLTCASCMVSPEVNCNWCTTTLQCSETCFAGSYKSQGQVEQCPKLLANRDMYLPSGLPKSITIQADNLIQGTEYQCVVKLVNRTIKTTVTANSDGNTLTGVLQASFENNTAKEGFPKSVFQVKETTQTEILDEYASYVTVYKCEYLASDCTTCNALNSNLYECNWCQDGHCGHMSVCSNAVTCPPPRITKINPSMGGYKGRTTITISGTDFGTNQNGVQEVKCAPLFESADYYACQCIDVEIIQTDDSDFHPVNKERDKLVHIVRQEAWKSRYLTRPEVEIRCQIQLLYHSEDMCVGLVNVTFLYEGLRAEPVSYRLVRPVVTHIEPVFGPMSGGTVITITGTELMIGNALNSVRLGSSYCQHITLNENRVICTSPPVTRTFSSTFKLKFDGESYGTDVVYDYVSSPVIYSISRQKTILSGGTNITFTGQNLKNAGDTRITIRYAGSEQSGNCSKISQEETNCPIPHASEILRQEMEENLNASDGDSSTEIGSISAYGFINYDGYVKAFPVQYFRNPSIDTIGGIDSVLEVDRSIRKLSINGQYMNLAADLDDYTISIGQTGNCDIIQLTINNLTCFLPFTSPGPDNENLEVIVSLGNFKKSVGYVIYNKSSEDESTDDIVLLIGVSVAMVLALLIMIGTAVFCVKYRRIKARTPKIRRREHENTQHDDVIGTPNRNTSFPTTRTDDQVMGQSTYMELDHSQNPGPNYESLDQNQDHDQQMIANQSSNTGIGQLNDPDTVYEGLD